MNPEERINQINLRLAELKSELDGCNEETRMAEIGTESKKLVTERASLIASMRQSILDGFNNGDVTDPAELRAQAEAEERSKKMVADLVNKRAISIDALDIIHNLKQSNVMNDTFNPVSHMVDQIPVVDAIGVETYQKPYLKGYGTGGYTAEGADPTAVEPEWGYAEMKKAKITAYTEVPEEFEKMAPKMYLDMIKKNLSMSIKRKLALEIIFGTGATNNLSGILTSAASAISDATDIEMAAIASTTLNEIVFSYGGDEDVTEATLYLNKKDLKLLSRLNDSDGRPLHKIDYKAKTIDGIPYEINSNITDSASAAASGYFMFYGAISNYELAMFSQLEVKKSEDYKFKEGVIAYKASGIFGGNVVAYNGFVRVKKPAA